jgi:threonine/homoserine/homoserine lactone efflux protein
VFRTFGLAWLIAFTGAATPGPLLALVIGQVLAQGFCAVLLILLGHALREVLFIGGFALGLGRVLQRPRVRGGLAMVGGLALAWMGLDILVHAPEATLAAATSQALAWPLLVAAGAGVSLSNPYFTGWWATVGTGQMATFGLRRPADYVAFWTGHEMGDFVWYAFVAALLALGRGLLSDPVYQGLLQICGGAICLLAVLFLVLGVRSLRERGNAPA